MKLLAPKVNIDNFFNNLKKAENALLFLDYDGTLAPFQINPDDAVPYPGIMERLHRIILGEKTHMIILSGRSLYDLLPLIPLAPLPDLWGSHGGERLTMKQKYWHENLSDKQEEGLRLAIETAKKLVSKDRIEQKPLSIAVHWRGMDAKQQEEIHKNVLKEWIPIAPVNDMEVHTFNGGLEFRPIGVNKGKVIKKIIEEIHAELPMPIAYLGDDRSDEEAFEVLGDRALKVLVGAEERETLADLWIRPPEELIAFLDRWIENDNVTNG